MDRKELLDIICDRKLIGTDYRDAWLEWTAGLWVKRDANPVNVMWYCGDEHTGHWRSRIPAMQLAQDPRFNVRMCRQDAAEPDDLAWADVFWFQRGVDLRLMLRRRPTLPTLVEQMQARGKRVVFDLDDWLSDLPPWNGAAPLIEGGHVLDRALHMMAVCDLTSFSTPYLRDLYAPHCRATVVLPNSVAPWMWPGQPGCPWPAKEPERGVIAYAGAASHWGDLNVLDEPLGQLFAERDDVRLRRYGCDGPDLYPMPDGRRVLREVLPSVPQDRVDRIAYDERTHQLGLRMQGASVVVAPLALSYKDAHGKVVDCVFNRAKSNVKALEAAMLGAVCVATDIEPYRDGGLSVPIDGNDADAWKWCLDQLVTDEDHRRTLAAKARADVLERFNIERNVGLWADAILGVLQ